MVKVVVRHGIDSLLFAAAYEDDLYWKAACLNARDASSFDMSSSAVAFPCSLYDDIVKEEEDE